MPIGSLTCGGCGYETSSEYVRDLIRKDQDRQHLRQLLLDGAMSAQTEPVDEAYFEGIRNLHLRR